MIIRLRTGGTSGPPFITRFVSVVTPDCLHWASQYGIALARPLRSPSSLPNTPPPPPQPPPPPSNALSRVLRCTLSVLPRLPLLIVFLLIPLSGFWVPRSCRRSHHNPSPPRVVSPFRRGFLLSSCFFYPYLLA